MIELYLMKQINAYDQALKTQIEGRNGSILKFKGSSNGTKGRITQWCTWYHMSIRVKKETEQGATFK